MVVRAAHHLHARILPCAQLTICMVVRFNATGAGEMELSFHDSAACLSGDSDFNHVVSYFAFNASAQSARCPGSALAVQVGGAMAVQGSPPDRWVAWYHHP